MMKSGKPQRGPDGGPPDRAQRNFTDSGSRIQPLRSKAVIAGYNAQIAVDGAHQIIVAQRLQTSSADARALPGLRADIRAVSGANPEEISADAGYCDEQNLRHLARRRIDGYIAPGRARHGEKHAAGSRRWPKGSRKACMAMKLRRAGRRSGYRLRKQIVEPVFGQIKQARGFRQFLLRGLNKVRGEWAMVCTVHNLLKLAKATGRPHDHTVCHAHNASQPACSTYFGAGLLDQRGHRRAVRAAARLLNRFEATHTVTGRGGVLKRAHDGS
jgi:Transposase DDE domain